MQAVIGKQFPKEVIPLIDSARHTIKIVVFFWGWYGEEPGNPCQLFNASILRAVKRGVVVRACVNSQRIASPLRDNGIEVRIPVSKSLMHTKMVLIDDEILVLGSHNFSQSAFTTNFETSIIAKNDECMPKFTDFFDSLWSLQ
jgi:phosphatidylserine/phosphatidylglycerophosphate/cardiolipin synthase-like enzyme